ncbi:MAG: very short patch repair endonuclease [Candidatus Eisenbacteria bacterium]
MTSTSRVKSHKPDRPSPSSPEARNRMLATRRRDTPEEVQLRSRLHRMGLRFRVDWPIPGSRRRADIAFVRPRVLVFVDGCFWHGCPKHGTWPKANAAWWRQKIEGNIVRDRDTDAVLRSGGWLVLRFWEHDDLRAAAREVADAVRRRMDRSGQTRV